MLRGENTSLPVDVRRSKTPLLKFPNMAVAQTLNDPKGDHSKIDNLSLEAILGAMASHLR